jgi:hypothetical protein
MLLALCCSQWLLANNIDFVNFNALLTVAYADMMLPCCMFCHCAMLTALSCYAVICLIADALIGICCYVYCTVTV